MTNATNNTELRDTERYLMNLVTGSIDTESQWLSDMTTWEGDAQEQFESLVEVVKNTDGDWVEA